MKCYKQCESDDQSCDQTQCRLWIDYEDDLNCTIVAVENNKNPGNKMTLREVSERLGISFVRVKQIEEKALNKLGITSEEKLGITREELRMFFEEREDDY